MANMKTDKFRQAAGCILLHLEADTPTRILFLRRSENETSFHGLWEFPGGKREPDESFEECLVREIHEELSIEIEFGQLFEEIIHDYPRKTVHLKFFLCRLLKGDPRAIGCAAYEWAALENLTKHEFPPADARLLRRLVDTQSLWR